MKKFLTLILIVILATLVGGIYGALHDQLTYTISPEYYTKYKFIQFGFIDEDVEVPLTNPRLWVAAVGFLATWWMGTPIGFVLGLAGLIRTTWKTMLIVTLQAFIITLIVAFATGITGLIYGRFFLANNPIESFGNRLIPGNLIDFKNFIAVGSMHNFSYTGGVVGLIAGITYSLSQKKRRLKLGIA